MIKEHINGYSCSGFYVVDGKSKTVLDEIYEEKMDVLKAIFNWVNNEIELEMKKKYECS